MAWHPLKLRAGKLYNKNSSHNAAVVGLACLSPLGLVVFFKINVCLKDKKQRVKGGNVFHCW